jgi:hypothetical protein
MSHDFDAPEPKTEPEAEPDAAPRATAEELDAVGKNPVLEVRQFAVDLAHPGAFIYRVRLLPHAEGMADGFPPLELFPATEADAFYWVAASEFFGIALAVVPHVGAGEDPDEAALAMSGRLGALENRRLVGGAQFNPRTGAFRPEKKP